MTEQLTVPNLLRLAIFTALVGIIFMLYRLPDKIGREILVCGIHTACEIEGSVSLSYDTIKDLQKAIHP